MGENLRAHIDDALLSRKVAIRTDAQSDIQPGRRSVPTFDPNDVVRLSRLWALPAEPQGLPCMAGGSAAGVSTYKQPLLRLHFLFHQVLQAGRSAALADRCS